MISKHKIERGMHSAIYKTVTDKFGQHIAARIIGRYYNITTDQLTNAIMYYTYLRYNQINT